ncbi:MAG TPA: O-antigen ligase family protein, partial [Bacteroidota bacterium]|nr:O-antigen ligase family protein [Bacteroidota bacterium]
MNEETIHSLKISSPTILFGLLVCQLAFISVSIAAASIAFGLSLVFVAYWSIVERRWLFVSTPLDYFFLAYAAVEFLTTATAIFPAQALVNTKRLLLITIVYMVVISFDSREKMMNSLLIIFGTVGVLSIVEIFYYFVSHEGRLSVFQHYMTTGGIKMIVCLMTIPFVLHTGTPSAFKKWSALFFAPTFIALILTNTRSSWVGFVAAFIVLSFLKNKYLFLVLLLFIGLFFLVGPERQVQRAKSIIDPTDVTNHTRLVMWATGLKIFSDHPILGIGDSDVHEVYIQYKAPDDMEPGGHLHNNYIMFLVTLGIVGFSVVCAMLGKVFLVERHVFKIAAVDWLTGSIALGSLSAFVGFLVNGFFEWNFGDHEIMVFVWFTL